MHKVKSVTNNDQRKLICQLCFFQEIFDTFRVVTVWLSTNPLNLLDLSSLASCLQSKITRHFSVTMYSWNLHLIHLHITTNATATQNYGKISISQASQGYKYSKKETQLLLKRNCLIIINELHSLWNPEVQCHIHKDSPIVLLLNQINPIPHINTY